MPAFDLKVDSPTGLLLKKNFKTLWDESAAATVYKSH
jgi:hypothetical protein